ncbi:hypothetical protein K432DRAFT_410236 [Lepidopterella palustris CBS 459.81]|uniref:Uncharacterized protein n=1 Tax=Lepidopterella palustris CBS 459.81 TaxID=1314670 RepID=A0A8E2DYG8_9PEZI|nr:hypothetical protein K432DRAFT_410236 [Lepidopterella palustris CBS 459.81]
MARSALKKETLRNRAKKLISSKDNVKLAPEETTRENNFRYKQSPNIYAIVVNKGSDRGFI